MSDKLINRDAIEMLRKVSPFTKDYLLYGNSQRELYIYVGNLDTSPNKKYLFVLKDARETYDGIIEASFVNTNHLERLSGFELPKNKLFEVSYIGSRTRIDFITVRAFVDKFGYSALRNILTEKALQYLVKYDYKFKVSTDKSETNETQPERKDKMNKTMNKVMNKNSDAAKIAAQITAGNALNSAVLEKIKPQLPLMVRGYAETAIAPVIVANIISFAVQTYASDNEKAEWVADAMLTAAMADFVNMFDIESLLADVLATAEVSIPDKDKVE